MTPFSLIINLLIAALFGASTKAPQIFPCTSQIFLLNTLLFLPLIHLPALIPLLLAFMAPPTTELEEISGITLFKLHQLNVLGLLLMISMPFLWPTRNLACALLPPPFMEFNDMVLAASLKDLGYKGSQYTWANNRSGQAYVAARLDRVFCKSRWLESFQILVLLTSQDCLLIILLYYYLTNLLLSCLIFLLSLMRCGSHIIPILV